MKKKKEIRSKWLTVRLNDEEYRLLEGFYRGTTCRQLSDYVRRLVLNKPVNVKYRNTSIDDFLTDMLALKRELNAIGNNFNQSVHKLHTLERLPEFRDWVIKNEDDKTIIFKKIDEIMTRINQLHATWSQ